MSNEDEIRKLEERLRQAELDPNTDTSAVFDELLADDVIFFPSGKTLSKIAALEGHRPPKKRPFSKVENTELTIRDFGEGVEVHSRTEYSIGTTTFPLVVIKLWVRRQGAWKVALAVFPNPPVEQR